MSSSRSLLGPDPAPEVALLVCGARLDGDAGAVARNLGLLDGRLDWDLLLEIARTHEVDSLLFRSLSTVAPDWVPATVLHRLRDWTYATAARNLFLTDELLRIVGLLAAGGILAVPFKGPVLAMMAYGDLSLRSFVDLDILIDQVDVPRVDRLLRGHGYRPAERLSGFRRVAYLQSECSYDYAREDGMVTVEIHWALMPRYFSFPLSLADVRDELGSVSLGRVIVPSLSVEASLLYLCLHGTKHEWTSLKWICDVARLVTSHEAVDWDRVIRRAGDLGGQRMFRLGLLLASDLVGAQLPVEVVRWLADDEVALALANDVGTWLARRRHRRVGAGNLFHLRAMTSRRRRLRYCLHLATVPTKDEWHALPLPAPLSFLYYPLHPAWLAGRAAGGLARQVHAAVSSSSRSTA